MNATRVRRLAGIAKIFLVIPVLGQIGLGVKPPDRHTADGGELRVPAVIQIDAGRCADRLFWRLFQRFSQRSLGQRFFRVRRWRPSKTSAIGLSATPLGSFFLFTKSAIEVSVSIIEMRKMLGKSYSSGNYRTAFSVRLFGFSRWALAQYGLQLVAGLNFDENSLNSS